MGLDDLVAREGVVLLGVLLIVVLVGDVEEELADGHRVVVARGRGVPLPGRAAASGLEVRDGHADRPVGVRVEQDSAARLHEAEDHVGGFGASRTRHVVYGNTNRSRCVFDLFRVGESVEISV